MGGTENVRERVGTDPVGGTENARLFLGTEKGVGAEEGQTSPVLRFAASGIRFALLTWPVGLLAVEEFDPAFFGHQAGFYRGPGVG
jgi:hypothetical protein